MTDIIELISLIDIENLLKIEKKKANSPVLKGGEGTLQIRTVSQFTETNMQMTQTYKSMLIKREM